MSNCTNTLANCYEYTLFDFIVSNAFDLICTPMLPTKSMQTTKATWPISGRGFGKIFDTWLIDVVHDKRRKRNPKLFKIRDYTRVIHEESKSKTTRVRGWSMWPSRSMIKDDSINKY